MDICTDPNALKLISIVLDGIDVLLVLGVVTLIILGMVDFFKATLAKDNEGIKKNSMLFFKRLFPAMLMFFRNRFCRLYKKC